MQTRTQFLEHGLVPVQNASKHEENEECAICTDAFEDPVALAPCTHAFCRKCITAWLAQRSKNTCPSCRRVLFAVDDADRGPVGRERVLVMSQALQHSGLLDGTYREFNEEIELNRHAMNRATASANRWLAEAHHPLTASGPAVVERKYLGYHLVAMANLLQGYARAAGRSYSRRDLRDWRLIVNALYAVLGEEDGRQIDAATLPDSLRRKVQVSLMRERANVGRWFQGSDADAESSTGDLDVLLSYMAAKAAEEFARREERRSAVRRERTVVGKVGLILKQYFFS
ncbi:Tripartite motif-containing 60 [Lecanosticta acicola]|uniref:Tripartite motif-containing 60 n=1 Tax=Lecanosticta acicola TaxID=111012 RepID=A0AAI8YT37_9PEZI|nr:Tripartite motif-containing 60 [Lecanosticta acicola]